MRGSTLSHPHLKISVFSWRLAYTAKWKDVSIFMYLFECGSHYNKTTFATVKGGETTLKTSWRPPPKWTPWTLPQRLEAPQLRPGQWQVKVCVILQISTKQHLRWKEYKLMSALFTLSKPGERKIRKLVLGYSGNLTSSAPIMARLTLSMKTSHSSKHLLQCRLRQNNPVL